MHSENAKSSHAVLPAAGIQRSELPRLDLLRSFEAAARTLSFTLAARELFLTQSAVSRQIQQIEAGLGVPLFERRHRALALTEAGQVLQRAVVDCLERLRDATARVRAGTVLRQVAVTTTPGFASLWLIPRLARFTADHPLVDVRVSATNEVLDPARARIDVAVRFCRVSDGVGRPLFEETVLPVCAPQLASDPTKPLRRLADLAHHSLLTVELPQESTLNADWAPWLQVMGLPELRTRNTLRFTHYGDAVAAAVAGQGVVIGRLPLVAELVRAGRLVAPFGGAASQRGYFVVAAPRAASNPDAQDFVRWLMAEAQTPAAADVVDRAMNQINR
jgi:DNA-binding transcriptional LysR family regulator